MMSAWLYSLRLWRLRGRGNGLCRGSGGRESWWDTQHRIVDGAYPMYAAVSAVLSQVVSGLLSGTSKPTRAETSLWARLIRTAAASGLPESSP